MSWLDWLRPNRMATASLDVEATLAAGPRNEAAAEQAIGRLKRERKAVERERRALHAQSKGVRPKQARTMVRSSPDMPELAVYEVSQAMHEANQPSHADTQRREQLAAVEARLEAINRALAQLDASIRPSRR